MAKKSSILPAIIGWIHSALFFVVLFALFAKINHVTGSGYAICVLSSLLLIIPSAIGWFLVRRIKNIFAYALFAIATTTCCIYLVMVVNSADTLGQITATIFTIIGCTLLFGLHAYAKLKYNKTKFEFEQQHREYQEFTLKIDDIKLFITHLSPFHWVWFGCFYFISIFTNDKHLLNISFYALLVDILLFFVYEMITGFEHYINTNRHLTNLPIKTMKHIHRIIFAITTIILIFCIAPSVIYGQEMLLGKFNIPETKRDIAVEPIGDTYEQEEDDPKEDLMNPSKDFDLMQVRAPEYIHVLTRLVCCFLLLILCIFSIPRIIRGVQKLSQQFNQDIDDEIVFLDDATTDDSSLIRKKKVEKEKYFSTNMKVRRIYKKKIMKSTSGIPNSSFTPTQLEEAANLNTDSMEGLHLAYEKARYSKNGCSDDDLANLK